MDAIVDALAAQQAELAGLLADLEDAGWSAPTRCEGWDVADVVLHLAQTDELAVGSARGRFTAVAAELTEGAAPVGSVDDGAALDGGARAGSFRPGPVGALVVRGGSASRRPQRHGPVRPGHVGGR